MWDSALTSTPNSTRISSRIPLVRLLTSFLFILWMGIVGGCTPATRPDPALELQLLQRWQLQPGDTLGGYSILGGLGDISIALKGQSVYAPFDGKTQWDTRKCIIFSSPDVPAYLFRLCGLSQPHLGLIGQGEAIGTADILQFATLRKQADNRWAMVEPSRDIVQRALKPLRP